jgi:hypothetical protein
VTLPSFLVIGAGRSGTTSLHHWLAGHPEVFVGDEKSPNFFVAGEPLPPWEPPAVRAMARHWIADRAAYERTFDRAGGARAIGEVSPVYLQARAAPRRIRELCPDVQLVAILREPVARAHAHFLGRRRDGLERRDDFEHVVAEELERGLPDEVAFGSYLGCGRYAHFLGGYFDLFPRQRIRIFLFEDLARDPLGVARGLFEFLGVDPRHQPDTTARHGRTGLVGNPIARLLWTRSVRLRTALRPHLPRRLRDVAAPLLGERLRQPSLDPELARRLRGVFRDDVRRLAEMIERDLTAWLEPPPAPGAAARAAGASSVASDSNGGSRAPDLPQR